MWAEMTRPDGTTKVLPFSQEEPGRFTALTTETTVGLYGFRVRAAGTTSKERPFTREQTATAFIGRTGRGEVPGTSELCRLFECIAREGAKHKDGTTDCPVQWNIDWKVLLECLRKHCRETTGRER